MKLLVLVLIKNAKLLKMENVKNVPMGIISPKIKSFVEKIYKIVS